jgi:MFS family permease
VRKHNRSSLIFILTIYLHYPVYGGRFLAGMGIGMLAMLAPLYQSEIAHPSIRGRLTTLQQFMLGVRALFVFHHVI